MSDFVNQQTIADQLNVSVATVSKALRDASDVSEATRAKVLQTATELGYQTSRLKKLAQTASLDHRFVGVLCRSYQEGGLWAKNTFFEGISQLSAKLNVSLVSQEVLFSHDDSEALDPKNQPPAMRNNSLAGHIVVGEWSAGFLKQLSATTPCVGLPYTIAGVDMDQIGLDHINSVSEIARHLHGLGHREIGFFGKCSSLTWASERFAGYVSALSQLGIEYAPKRAIEIDQNLLLEEGNEGAWKDLIDRATSAVKDGVTAWICSSDWPGNQLHKGLVDRGFNVPGDVSITGFDDTELVTLGMPPLTSTHLPRSEMGQAAVKRLIYRINEPKAATRRILFPCEIVDHGTTGPPPG